MKKLITLLLVFTLFLSVMPAYAGDATSELLDKATTELTANQRKDFVLDVMTFMLFNGEINNVTEVINGIVEIAQAAISSDNTENTSASVKTDPTKGEENALRKAESYLKALAFSHSGLIKQLEYEGFSKEEATYGADNCSADWNEQAVKKAASYLKSMSFSRKGLIKQLIYEGFTEEQAEYGATQNGY